MFVTALSSNATPTFLVASQRKYTTMEKEKPLTKPKRMRADRVRVRCLCCNQELNKDGLGDHYTRKHQISRKDDQKFVVVLPESQPKLTDFKVEMMLQYKTKWYCS